MPTDLSHLITQILWPFASTGEQLWSGCSFDRHLLIGENRPASQILTRQFRGFGSNRARFWRTCVGWVRPPGSRSQSDFSYAESDGEQIRFSII